MNFFIFLGYNSIERMVIYMDTISLILVIIGALNWGAIGLFGIDVVASVFHCKPYHLHPCRTCGSLEHNVAVPRQIGRYRGYEISNHGNFGAGDNAFPTGIPLSETVVFAGFPSKTLAFFIFCVIL